MSGGKSGTALLLVDFINLFDFPEADTLGPRAIAAARRTAALKERARAKGVPCIYANDNFGNWISNFAKLTEDCLARGGPSGVIAATLRPGPEDLSVLKPRHSAFYGTPLEFLLDELGVSRLIITGIITDSCVFATAQDAYVRQYGLWIPADCTASSSAAFERAALEQMSRTLKADTRKAQGSRWPWSSVAPRRQRRA